MSSVNLLVKLISDWRIIPLSTASCNFSSKDDSRSLSISMRKCGRLASTHIRKLKRMAPACTRYCGIRDWMTIWHAAEMIAWWYSRRIENISKMAGGVLESFGVVSFFHHSHTTYHINNMHLDNSVNSPWRDVTRKSLVRKVRQSCTGIRTSVTSAAQRGVNSNNIILHTIPFMTLPISDDLERRVVTWFFLKEA